jgi:RNA polymerase sigma-70 factor (ECF subfamily)
MQELRQYALGVAARVLARRADAEDVAQEAMVRVLQASRNGTAIAAQGAYVARTALRLAIDRLRRERLRAGDAGLAVQERQRGCDSAATPLDVERLYVAIVALPRRQAAVITLRKLMELEYADIAELLGISVENCRSHCRLGLQRLRATLCGNAAADGK